MTDSIDSFSILFILSSLVHKSINNCHKKKVPHENEFVFLFLYSRIKLNKILNLVLSLFMYFSYLYIDKLDTSYGNH